MKFMLIVHHNEDAFEKMDKETQSQLLTESIELTHQLHATGQYVHASPLHPAATAVMVRVREGKPLVTDGPFIETREQIAGYFLIQAQNLREAIDIAGKVPGARIGTVEVRPLIEIAGLPNTHEA
ncbi:MAG TPA: YciI family protein [Nitrospiraceae bacterium]|nr:YciI family protein [Nitrospiraceae bacterium]